MSDSALQVLLNLHHGVLSTHSLKEPGYPYGSLLPFCLDASGQPLGLISGLAQHTRNLRAEARASLTLSAYAEADQVLASPRLCLLVQARFLEPAEAEASAARYYRYLPSSPDYRLLQDFRFVRLEIVKAHYIAGFGQIHWLEAASLLRPSPFHPDQENALCEDLNSREGELLATLWHKLTGAEATEPVALAGIDGLGGDLRCGQRLLRYGFEQAVTELEAAWHQMHQGQVSLLS